MDQKTLNGLIAAHEAAPSAALVSIITLAFLARQDSARAGEWLERLPAPVPAESVGDITAALLANPDESLVQSFATRLDATSLQTLITGLDEAGYGRIARTAYMKAIRQNEALRSSELDSRLELKEPDERQKAKVQERPDFGEVTQLARYRQQSTSFASVVGLEDIKKQINRKIILPFQKPSLFQRFKKKVGGGVLLYGPPGCGKTLLARATAGECQSSFFNIEISDVLDMYIGESEQKLHAIFEKARSETPSVLFFDELEALAGKREHARSGSSSNTVSQFLTEMDGYAQNNEGLLILASTNVPWAIDSAFLRPGRFDRMFFVPPPDRVARAAILRHEMKDRPAADDIDYELLAEKTAGYSGADLANLTEMAADEAIDDAIASPDNASGQDDESVLIALRHFKTAFSDSKPTTTEWLTTARNYARYANDGGRYDDVLEFLQRHGKK